MVILQTNACSLILPNMAWTECVATARGIYTSHVMAQVLLPWYRPRVNCCVKFRLKVKSPLTWRLAVTMEKPCMSLCRSGALSKCFARNIPDAHTYTDHSNAKSKTCDAAAN